MATVKKSGDGEPIFIRPLDIRVMEIRIVGETELIVHQWSDKAKRMMLDKQMGKAVLKKQPKDPQKDYEESAYRFPDGRYGFPAVAFKAAIVGGCRNYKSLPMTIAKVAIRVMGEQVGENELVEIVGTPRMREDMVRLETGVADIRYRAGFPQWRATLRIKFNAGLVSPEALVNLVNGAGLGGVGEWRPSASNSHSGSFGCFTVDTER